MASKQLDFYHKMQFRVGSCALYLTEVSKKFNVLHQATMRSSIGINDFMTDLAGLGQSLSKSSSKTSSAIILLIFEKAKLVLPFTLCRLCGLVFN